jgi:hypothetical protein
MELESIYISVNGQTRRITTPQELEEAIREIVRNEFEKLNQLTEEET